AGEDGIEAYVKKVREGKATAESIAKVMDNTTVGAMKGLGSAAEGLAIVFGNTLTPVITATAHGLAFVTRGLTAAAEKFPNLTKVVGILTGGTIALTTAAVAGGYAWTFVSSGLLQAKKMYQLVNLCMSASTIKTVALSAAQKAAAIGTYAMTAAQWALNVALNANPIGLIVGGVAILVGLGAVLYKKFEPFQKLVDSIWGKIKKFMKIGGRFFGFGSDEDTETAEKAAKVGNVAGNIPTPPDNVVPFPERQSQGVAPVKFPEVSPAAMNSSSTAIEYKPQINITANGSNVAEVKAAADQSMMESEERVRKVMTDIHHDDRRRAFA
ncbi:phage tail tape measure protein, partial [Desulfoluna spongiiphila]